MDDDGDAEQLSRVQERLKKRKRKVGFEDQKEQDEHVDFNSAFDEQREAEKREEV